MNWFNSNLKPDKFDIKSTHLCQCVPCNSYSCGGFMDKTSCKTSCDGSDHKIHQTEASTWLYPQYSFMGGTQRCRAGTFHRCLLPSIGSIAPSVFISPVRLTHSLWGLFSIMFSLASQCPLTFVPFPVHKHISTDINPRAPGPVISRILPPTCSDFCLAAKQKVSAS